MISQKQFPVWNWNVHMVSVLTFDCNPSTVFNFYFLDFAIPSHMLEIYDFPKSVRTADLMNVSLSTRLH